MIDKFPFFLRINNERRFWLRVDLSSTDWTREMLWCNLALRCPQRQPWPSCPTAPFLRYHRFHRLHSLLAWRSNKKDKSVPTTEPSAQLLTLGLDSDVYSEQRTDVLFSPMNISSKGKPSLWAKFSQAALPFLPNLSFKWSLSLEYFMTPYFTPVILWAFFRQGITF